MLQSRELGQMGFFKMQVDIVCSASTAELYSTSYLNFAFKKMVVGNTLVEV